MNEMGDPAISTMDGLYGRVCDWFGMTRNGNQYLIVGDRLEISASNMKDVVWAARL